MRGAADTHSEASMHSESLWYEHGRGQVAVLAALFISRDYDSMPWWLSSKERLLNRVFHC